ncbi:hypothetical protein CWC05_00125 [Pseudoalteromonas ruthenica]|uniref:Uncharacterized protein n=1 Tax=Pseudoalteromonas ruthenica TaxID=151081 RepID=A0A5S3ZAW5_9GAMM|nr:hypothetical protein [Pseudoalteromonas ruthenica]TMP88797.1 hypothetical protein CWC05_00125 [Pseudoalteromonas ruthenica]
MLRLMLILSSFMASANAYSALTETKSCDDCDYNDAVAIAKQYHNKLTCQVIGSNEGMDEFGSTTYQCNKTSKEIIITNPLQRVAFKFLINAEQQSQYSNAVRVTAVDKILNKDEVDALEDFYDIDSEFRAKVKQTDIINYSFSGSSIGDSLNIADLPYSLSSTGDICYDHPSYYLTSIGAQTEIERVVADRIHMRLGSNDWYDFNEDTDFTGGEINVSRGGLGISVSLQHNQNKVYGTLVFDKYGGYYENSLVFEVEYRGEVEVNGQRRLQLSLALDKGASRVDGIPIGAFMSGADIDLTDSPVSECLQKNLENIQGATVTTSQGGGGETGGGDVGGTPVFGGGGCSKDIKYTTCSTAHGTTTCTENSVKTSC